MSFLSTFRLAAIDLDDTLLGEDKRVSRENLAALGTLHAAGLQVLIATGRHISRIRPYLDALPLVEWLVACQGAAIYECDHPEPVYELYLPPEDAERLLPLGIQRGFTTLLYSRDAVYSAGSEALLPFYLNLTGALPIPADPDFLLTLYAHKVLWLSDRPTIDELVSETSLLTPQIHGVRTEARMFEFVPAASSKARGVAIVAERLGVERSRILAFGDSYNDIPLFQWAGHSIAMPHGCNEARSAASETGPDASPNTALAAAVEQLAGR